MNYFKQLKNYFSAFTQCTTKCTCSHSVVMLESEPKAVCDWCGRTVYNKNELGQKQKFKDELQKAIVRREKENGTKNKQTKN